MIVEAGVAGSMSARFDKTTFSSGPSAFSFTNPTNTLILDTGTGGDGINIASLDPGFSASLVTYGQGRLKGEMTSANDVVALTKGSVSFDDGIFLDLTVNGYTHRFGHTGAGVRQIWLDGKSGNDQFTTADVLQIDDVTIIGGTGTDTLTGPTAGMQWAITGANSGTSPSTTTIESGVTVDWIAGAAPKIVRKTGDWGVLQPLPGDVLDITGTDDNDGFYVVVSVTTTVNPNDTLILSSNQTPVNLTDSVINLNRDSLRFNGFENLTGGTGVDRFYVREGGSISGIINGGGGAVSDILFGPDVNNTWTVTGTNAGTLNGVTDFSGIESLTGGSAGDEFQILPSGELTGVLDGGIDRAVDPAGTQAPVDTLSFALYGANVEVDLAQSEATKINEFTRIDSFVEVVSTETN